MTTLIVLFNLKNPASAAEYERWARESDVPQVRRLRSVESFAVLKGTGLLGGGPSPYQYFEIFAINDMKLFGEEIATEAIQKAAAQFNRFADNPLFIVTEPL